jgi:hypothetical protein
VADAVVQLLREDTITVMQQESVGMVSGNRFAELLQGPRRCRMRCDIGMQDAASAAYQRDATHCGAGAYIVSWPWCPSPARL